MNIFISWSGDRSHRVAKLLKTWIKGVIQAAKPWISSTDISSGTIWFTEIIKQLDATTQGIVCLTNENKEKPWILFEAGALANSGIESSRVYTLLVDVEQKDVQPPLSQFNLTKPDEEGMLKLMTEINSTLSDDVRLEKDVLARGFKAFWPEFESDFEKVINETRTKSSPEAVRSDKEILSEILDTVRGLDKRVREVEIVNQLPVARRTSKVDHATEQLIRIQQERQKRNAMRHLAMAALSRDMSDEQVLEYLQAVSPTMPIELLTKIVNDAKEALL